LRNGNRYLLISGLALAAFIVAGSPWFERILTVPTPLLVLAAIGIPFSLALPLLLGALQGEQRFVMLSVLTAGQAAVKLVGAVILGLLWGPVGVIAGISAASAVIYLVALAVIRPRSLTKTLTPQWNRLARYALLILCSTSGVAVLFSSDILLVKHFYDPGRAGQYSVIAAVGRGIFWGAGGVAAVLFPKLTFRESRGDSGRFVVLVSVLLAVAGGLIGMLALAVWSRSLLNLFAGPQYLGAASYLPQYAFAMTLFGVASILIAAFQSQGRWRFLWVLLPVTGLEPVLIALLHQSFSQVIGTVTLSSGLLLVGLAALYLLEPGGRERTSSIQPLIISDQQSGGTPLRMETTRSHQPVEPRV
jgi:O-antigen/teichoic acid export membrane protein